MVGLEGIEPPTFGLGNRCSILLSYRPTLGLAGAGRSGAASSASLVIIRQRPFISKGILGSGGNQK